MSHLVQERDLKLAEVILDRYNSRLHCPKCQSKYTPDKTTFTRDQAGRKGEHFYRKYRCKGKQKQACNANLGVQELIHIARKDLGEATIASLRVELAIPVTTPPAKHRRHGFQINPLRIVPIQNATPLPLLNTPVSKRQRDSTVHTNLTPEAKRINTTQSPIASYSTIIPETQELISDTPESTDKSQVIAKLQAELRDALQKIAVLENQLSDKSYFSRSNFTME